MYKVIKQLKTETETEESDKQRQKNIQRMDKQTSRKKTKRLNKYELSRHIQAEFGKNNIR